MTTTFTLLAPGAGKGQTFVVRSGNSYTSDSSGNLIGVIAGDISDLVNDGAVIIGTATLPINVTAATLTLTAATHANRQITLNHAAGCAVALPAAAGTGFKYNLIVSTTITSVGVIVSAAGSDKLQGQAWVLSDNSAAVLAYDAAGTAVTVTLNGTTQGGYLGHTLSFTDIGAGLWQVESFGKATGTEATPFS